MTKRLAIVLAAGKGTRMKSELPKVLCPVRGKPMIQFVLDTLRACGVGRIVVVVGYRADLVREALRGQEDLEFVVQSEQLGTGHAVMMCREQLQEHHGPVLIVTGDSPLTQASSIEKLFSAYEDGHAVGVLGTLHKEDPYGLGRIVRNQEGEFVAIVEEKDATDEQRALTEVNMSTYVFDAQRLLAALAELTNANEQQEYYVTDCPGILNGWGESVQALPVLLPCEALSVNTVEDLAIVDAEMEKMGL